jgi:hypothetical protein
VLRAYPRVSHLLLRASRHLLPASWLLTLVPFRPIGRARRLRFLHLGSRQLHRYPWRGPLLPVSQPVSPSRSNTPHRSGMLTALTLVPRTSYKEVRQGSVGLISRFGKFYKSVDPGLVAINVRAGDLPPSHRGRKADVRMPFRFPRSALRASRRSTSASRWTVSLSKL